MGRISVKGVLIGAITDILASSFIGIVGVIFLVIVSRLMHLQRGWFHGNGLVFVPLSLAGLACSALAGYVAAWLAKHDELLNGGLSSFLCVLFALFQLRNGNNYYPLSVRVLLLIAAPAFAVFGGYLRLRQKVDAQCK